eukprot:gene11720-8065_t
MFILIHKKALTYFLYVSRSIKNRKEEEVRVYFILLEIGCEKLVNAESKI